MLDVQDLTRGHLRLAVTPTFTAYLAGPLTGEFRAAHPGISLDVREMTQDRIEAALLANELDLGIAFHGGHLPGIDSAALLTESLSLVVGRRHGPALGHRADRDDPADRSGHRAARRHHARAPRTAPDRAGARRADPHGLPEHQRVRCGRICSRPRYAG